MGIVEEDLGRVRSETDLVALVSESVALRRVGTRWVGLCPFHAEKTPSFSINAELGFYYCFGCQARGDAITFVRETEHLDFVGAVELLAGHAGISLRYDDDRGGSQGERKQAGALHDLLEKAVAWYHERLLEAPDARPARKYLHGRGYDGDVVRHYRLGWAPDGWDAFVRASGAEERLLLGAGLAFHNQRGQLTDSFRARILFPIFDAAGRPVGFGGRVLPGGTGPKYKNTPATTLYDKSKTLYGLNWAKSAVVERGQVVVCEGYTDVIGLHRAGVLEAVATCGTALAEGHVRLLSGFARRVVLAYDADTAGQGAAEHFYDWERRLGADIAVVALPAGTDPADMAQRDPQGLQEAVAQARGYLGFRLERVLAAADLRNPEGRARAAQDCMALIDEHPDVLVRDQYLMQVADRCHLSSEQLRNLPPPGRPTAAGPPGMAQGRPAKDPRAQGVAAREEGRAGGAERRPARPRVPRPELEALRLAVHQPERVAGRLRGVLFSSDLAREAFSELAAAMTLHDAVEASPPEVADLLGRVAVEESQEDADDVLRRLMEQGASRALEDLRREARSAAPSRSHGELAQETRALHLALEELRSLEPGPGDATRLAAAEERLLALLLGRSTNAS